MKGSTTKVGEAKVGEGKMTATMDRGNHRAMVLHVPMLRYGPLNNFDVFKKRLAIACLEKYKNLGRIINDEKYYVPPNINPLDYDLTHDMMDIKKG